MKLCYEITDLDFPIKLEQKPNGLFRVTHGQECHDNLGYLGACAAYGECIFHALGCSGSIDNGCDTE